jgi:hypothetical protein
MLRTHFSAFFGLASKAQKLGFLHVGRDISGLSAQPFRFFEKTFDKLI